MQHDECDHRVALFPNAELFRDVADEVRRMGCGFFGGECQVKEIRKVVDDTCKGLKTLLRSDAEGAWTPNQAKMEVQACRSCDVGFVLSVWTYCRDLFRAFDVRNNETVSVWIFMVMQWARKQTMEYENSGTGAENAFRYLGLDLLQVLLSWAEVFVGVVKPLQLPKQADVDRVQSLVVAEFENMWDKHTGPRNENDCKEFDDAVGILNASHLWNVKCSAGKPRIDQRKGAMLSFNRKQSEYCEGIKGAAKNIAGDTHAACATLGVLLHSCPGYYVIHYGEFRSSELLDLVRLVVPCSEAHGYLLAMSNPNSDCSQLFWTAMSVSHSTVYHMRQEGREARLARLKLTFAILQHGIQHPQTSKWMYFLIDHFHRVNLGVAEAMEYFDLTYHTVPGAPINDVHPTEATFIQTAYEFAKDAYGGIPHESLQSKQGRELYLVFCTMMYTLQELGQKPEMRICNTANPDVELRTYIALLVQVVTTAVDFERCSTVNPNTPHALTECALRLADYAKGCSFKCKDDYLEALFDISEQGNSGNQGVTNATYSLLACVALSESMECLLGMKVPPEVLRALFGISRDNWDIMTTSKSVTGLDPTTRSGGAFPAVALSGLFSCVVCAFLRPDPSAVPCSHDLRAKYVAEMPRNTDPRIVTAAKGVGDSPNYAHVPIMDNPEEGMRLNLIHPHVTITELELDPDTGVWGDVRRSTNCNAHRAATVGETLNTPPMFTWKRQWTGSGALEAMGTDFGGLPIPKAIRQIEQSLLQSKSSRRNPFAFSGSRHKGLFADTAWAQKWREYTTPVALALVLAPCENIARQAPATKHPDSGLVARPRDGKSYGIQDSDPGMHVLSTLQEVRDSVRYVVNPNSNSLHNSPNDPAIVTHHLGCLPGMLPDGQHGGADLLQGCFQQRGKGGRVSGGRVSGGPLIQWVDPQVSGDLSRAKNTYDLFPLKKAMGVTDKGFRFVPDDLADPRLNTSAFVGLPISPCAYVPYYDLRTTDATSSLGPKNLTCYCYDSLASKFNYNIPAFFLALTHDFLEAGLSFLKGEDNPIGHCGYERRIPSAGVRVPRDPKSIGRNKPGKGDAKCKNNKSGAYLQRTPTNDAIGLDRRFFFRRNELNPLLATVISYGPVSLALTEVLLVGNPTDKETVCPDALESYISRRVAGTNDANGARVAESQPLLSSHPSSRPKRKSGSRQRANASGHPDAPNGGSNKKRGRKGFDYSQTQAYKWHHHAPSEVVTTLSPSAATQSGVPDGGSNEEAQQNDSDTDESLVWGSLDWVHTDENPTPEKWEFYKKN